VRLNLSIDRLLDYPKRLPWVLLTTIIVSSIIKVIISQHLFIHDDEFFPIVSGINTQTCYEVSVGERVLKSEINNNCKEFLLTEISPINFNFQINEIGAFLKSLKTSYQMTFGPLYSYIGNLIASSEKSLSDQIKIRRLISVLLSIFAIPLVYFFFKKNFDPYIAVLLSTIFSFSIMHITQASYAYAYGSNTFFLIIIFHKVQEFLKLNKIGINHLFSLSLISAISFYYDFSFIVLSAAVYLTIFIFIFKKKDFLEQLRDLVLSGFFYLFLIIPGLFLFIFSGKKIDFIATRKDIHSLSDAENFFQEILIRFSDIVNFNLGFSSNEFLNLIFSYLLLFFILVSLIIFVTKRIHNKENLFFYILIITFICLIVIGSYFGFQRFIPSRNSLILSVPILFIIGIGMDYFKTKLNSENLHKFGVVSSCIFILMTASLSFYSRFDQLNSSLLTSEFSSNIDSLAKEKDVVQIVTPHIIAYSIIKEQTSGYELILKNKNYPALDKQINFDDSLMFVFLDKDIANQTINFYQEQIKDKDVKNIFFQTNKPRDFMQKYNSKKHNRNDIIITLIK